MTLRFVEEMKTSSPEYRSSGRKECSATDTPASGAISIKIPRVTPSRQPEFRGGVSTLPFFTAKILAEVHSDTSLRSLSNTTSSKPSLAASATAQTLFSQEILLIPESAAAAWRPWGRSAKRALSEY